MSKKRQVCRESEKASFTGHRFFQWMARAWPGRRRPRAVHMQSRDASDPPRWARGVPRIGRADVSAACLKIRSKTLGVMRFWAWRPNWCSQSAMSDAISALGPKRPMRQPSVFTVSGAHHHFPGCARHHWGRCLARPPAPECVYMRSRGALGGPRAPKHVYMVLWCSLGRVGVPRRGRPGLPGG